MISLAITLWDWLDAGWISAMEELFSRTIGDHMQRWCLEMMYFNNSVHIQLHGYIHYGTFFMKLQVSFFLA